MFMIKGNIVELIPAKMEDRQKIYDWCFHSETTKSHSGPPDYPNHPISTFEEFFSEYADYFFTGEFPEKGRGFMITHDGDPVGFISCCSFHMKPNKSEFDIWMNSEANCGKGFGTDAIVSLANYLNENLGINEMIMRPSIKNERALTSYKKAGFNDSDKDPSEYLLPEYVDIYGDGDYGADESALLVKQM